MIINMIAAMASNRIVGNNNQLPRHYSQDLQHFKKVTTGHIVVMGYNTYLSIGRPLPNRRNIVLSKSPVEGIETYESIENMMKQLQSENIDQIFIIG
jgi:dihydrofolate reductase